MSSIQRNNSTLSSGSIISKHGNITHCIVQFLNDERTRKIVCFETILNPSNRRLKTGDECTIKGVGRHHSRVKILFSGDLNSCQYQLEIIGESGRKDTITSFDQENTSSGDENGHRKDSTTSEDRRLVEKPLSSGIHESTNRKSSNETVIPKKPCMSSHSSKPRPNVHSSSSNRENNASNGKNNDPGKSTSHVANQSRHHEQKTRSTIESSPIVGSRVPTTPQTTNVRHQQNSVSKSIARPTIIEEFHLSNTQSVIRSKAAAEETLSSEFSTEEDAASMPNEMGGDGDDEIVPIDAIRRHSDAADATDKQSDGAEADTTVDKYNRLLKRFDQVNKQMQKLEKENEMLKKTMLPLPSPDIQQWFILTARRFENKPLSGAVLERCAEALKLPASVLIALRQDTGTLTARAVVRHLFPSKSRTLDDINDSIREAILDYVKFSHPTELFVRGKINEAISGPFRTAKFKTLHSLDG